MTPELLWFRLEPEPGAIVESRRLVRDALEVWGVDGLATVVALLASELVTNALLHAEPPIDLTFDWNDPVVRVGVSDGGDGMPEMPALPLEGDGGFGLRLVESLSDEWGTERRVGGGKVVWFELGRSRQQR